MKKALLIFAFALVIAGCKGCKNGDCDDCHFGNNPYPLTNQVQHADGTQVKAPTW